MSARPLVATVAYHLDPGRVTRWPEGGYGVPAPYLDALRRAGARVAIVAPGEPGTPRELLEAFDGLMLVGGGDVDPARYGGASDRHVYGVETDRDELETELLRAAGLVSLPILCICRGMQVMNVAFGGSLHPHLPDLEGTVEHGIPVADTRTMHEVRAEPGSLLQKVTGDDVLSCSSHHHQGVDRLGDGLVAAGRSDDGLVEAIERTPGDPGSDAWLLGVQWHPEDTAAGDASQQALFDGFVRAAAHRAGSTDIDRQGGTPAL